jgi:hypothetical protein
VLLSGSATVLGFGCIILFSAACLHTILYRVVGDFLVALAVDIVASELPSLLNHAYLS